jgi:carbon monoxide dehydrogenase subunit G
MVISMGFRAAALILFLAFCAAPAANGARRYDAEPAVSVEPAAAADAVEIKASIEIAAPRAKVWAIMTDCARSLRYVPGLISCRVLKRDPAGRWDIREHKISWMWFLPNVTSVFRSDYDPPKRLSFHRIGGTLKRSDGAWRLDTIDGGSATRVSYDATVSADIPAPRFMVEAALKRDIAKVLRGLRRQCTSATQQR